MNTAINLIRTALKSFLEKPKAATTSTEPSERVSVITQFSAGPGRGSAPAPVAQPSILQLAQQILSALPDEPEPITWNLESLAHLVDVVIGKGTARSVLRRPLYFSSGASSISAKLASCTNEFERKSLAGQWEEEFASNQASAAAKNATEDFEKLRNFLFKSRVVVPGLSYAGLSVGAGTEFERNEKAVAFHQKAINEFCAVLDGDAAAAMSASRPAAAARQFLAARKGAYHHFQVGDRLKKTNL